MFRISTEMHRVQPYEVHLHMLHNFASIYTVVQYKHDCLRKFFRDQDKVLQQSIFFLHDAHFWKILVVAQHPAVKNHSLQTNPTWCLQFCTQIAIIIGKHLGLPANSLTKKKKKSFVMTKSVIQNIVLHLQAPSRLPHTQDCFFIKYAELISVFKCLQ